jgi:hypothetical protein
MLLRAAEEFITSLNALVSGSMIDQGVLAGAATPCRSYD